MLNANEVPLISETPKSVPLCHHRGSSQSTRADSGDRTKGRLIKVRHGLQSFILDVVHWESPNQEQGAPLFLNV